jgi:TonB family protein
LNALLAMAGNHPALDLAPATLFLRKRHLKNRVALLLKEITMSKRKLISFCAASCGVLLAAGWLALHTFPLQAAPVPQDQESGKLLHSVAPKYPQAAREKHVEGAVVLEVHIDAKGHVSSPKVISGPEELRSAALEAVLQWHYNPQAMTLPATTQVTMNFKLPPEGAPAGPPDSYLEGKRVMLQNITVEGLTPSSRDELLQRLPVHQGGILDADGMRATMASAAAFDEHLRVALLLNPSDENSASLRISLAPAGPPTRIRIGANVQRAKLLVKVTPVYPAEAKAQRIEGEVRLEAIVGKDGKVENLQMLSGDPLLAAAALDAVRQWQYQTTLLNGDPVEVVTEIAVNFTLSK